MRLIICILLVLIISVINAQSFDDDCTENCDDRCTLQNGKFGVCVHIRQCKSALREWRKNRYYVPPTCYFEGRYPVVCCETSQNIVTPGSKSIQKCKEIFGEWEYRRLYSRFGGSFFALTGGFLTLSKEFPHMAALGFGDKNDIQWNCGGSLISEKFVLTAAHCIVSKNLGEVQYVRLGDLNLKTTTDDAKPQNFRVKRTIRHPSYKPPAQYNDIALIELDREASINDYVKPACLQITKDVDDSIWIATGWGHLEFGGTTSDHLQKVDLNEINNEECRRSYSDVSLKRLAIGVDDNTQVCAGGYNKDTCQGDSGGPLQRRNKEYSRGYTIIGVTSFGKACGVANSPGVYTRVSNYISWIEEHVWPIII